MKSWHIILIGIFVVIVISMIIRYAALAKLAELETNQLNNNINPNVRLMTINDLSSKPNKTNWEKFILWVKYGGQGSY